MKTALYRILREPLQGEDWFINNVIIVGNGLTLMTTIASCTT